MKYFFFLTCIIIILGLQTILIDGRTSESVGPFLVEELCRSSTHKGCGAQYVETARSTRSEVDALACLACSLGGFGIEIVIGKGTNGEGYDVASCGKSRQGYGLHTSGRGGLHEIVGAEGQKLLQRATHLALYTFGGKFHRKSYGTLGCAREKSNEFIFGQQPIGHCIGHNRTQTTAAHNCKFVHSESKGTTKIFVFPEKEVYLRDIWPISKILALGNYNKNQ